MNEQSNNDLNSSKKGEKLLRSGQLLNVSKKKQGQSDLFKRQSKQLDKQIGKEIINTTQKKPKIFPLYPEDKFRQYWDISLLLMLVLTALITPVRVCFISEEDANSWIYVDYFFDVYFFFDILINFVSVFLNGQNQIESSFQKIAVHYLTGWFIIDLVAIFPFQHTLKKSKSSSYNKLFRLLRLPRLYRLTKILKLSQGGQDSILSKINDVLQMNIGVRKMLQILLMMVGMSHFAASFWYFLAKLDDYAEDTWVSRYGIIEQSYFSKYISSFYWAFQTLTTVGYGDITTVTMQEQLFAIFWQVIGVGFYSFTIGNLSEVILEMNQLATFYNRTIENVENLCIEFKVPQQIQLKIQKFIEINYRMNKFWGDNYLQKFGDLPHEYLETINLFTYSSLLAKIDMFQINLSFTSQIYPYLQFQKVLKGDFVYRKGDPSLEVFFVFSGKIQLANQNSAIELVVNQGDCFGEIEILDYKKREHFAVAEQDCVLIFCKQENFIKLIDKFWDIKEYLILLIQDKKDFLEIIKMRLQTNYENNFYILKQNYNDQISFYENASGYNGISFNNNQFSMAQNSRLSQDTMLMKVKNDQESKELIKQIQAQRINQLLINKKLHQSVSKGIKIVNKKQENEKVFLQEIANQIEDEYDQDLINILQPKKQIDLEKGEKVKFLGKKTLEKFIQQFSKKERKILCLNSKNIFTLIQSQRYYFYFATCLNQENSVENQKEILTNFQMQKSQYSKFLKESQNQSNLNMVSFSQFPQLNQKSVNLIKNKSQFKQSKTISELKKGQSIYISQFNENLGSQIDYNEEDLIDQISSKKNKEKSKKSQFADFLDNQQQKQKQQQQIQLQNQQLYQEKDREILEISKQYQENFDQVENQQILNSNENLALDTEKQLLDDNSSYQQIYDKNQDYIQTQEADNLNQKQEINGDQFLEKLFQKNEVIQNQIENQKNFNRIQIKGNGMEKNNEDKINGDTSRISRKKKKQFNLFENDYKNFFEAENFSQKVKFMKDEDLELKEEFQQQQQDTIKSELDSQKNQNGIIQNKVGDNFQESYFNYIEKENFQGSSLEKSENSQQKIKNFSEIQMLRIKYRAIKNNLKLLGKMANEYKKLKKDVYMLKSQLEKQQKQYQQM
ncbi:Cyclic nucleotide-binding protein [Pseudocohnilembus persalinus]|uniref:Cyclic nucleotide-binding protein n=1 Tax=Pseudocohnilembus persalinus TaxID=266149 RepID=A0A0V0QIG7_PSEPJ|nr:Cyclic nucleotide-binding protein [Pseudocohnilembus persalinus]|eukprot:KRX02099.1 Cyclic nucleotide-binding protein [Pseudocohnilembus persalinus]